MKARYNNLTADKIKDMPSVIDEFNKFFANSVVNEMEKRGIRGLYLQGKITFDIRHEFDIDNQAMKMLADFRPTN